MFDQPNKPSARWIFSSITPETGRRQVVQDMTDEDWDSTIRINLTAAFATCREAVRRWLASGRRGRIINITTASGLFRRDDRPRALRGGQSGPGQLHDLPGAGISPARHPGQLGRPGLIQTDMTAEAIKKNWARYRERIPLDRVGDPAEVADAVVFLASDRASYITGTALHVNGGMYMA